MHRYSDFLASSSQKNYKYYTWLASVAVHSFVLFLAVLASPLIRTLGIYTPARVTSLNTELPFSEAEVYKPHQECYIPIIAEKPMNTQQQSTQNTAALQFKSNRSSLVQGDLQCYLQ